MDNDVNNFISTKELYSEYDWYESTFKPVIQDACDDFFTQMFDLEFISLSKNINPLQNNEACFVTKIKIDKEYDIFFRLNDKVISIILEKSLGKSNTKFSINKISELEAKIITSFNSLMFEGIKSKLSSSNPKELKRTNFDVINLTFLLKDKQEEIKTTGKIFISIPATLLKAEQVQSQSEKFSKEDFNQTEVCGKVFVGKTKSTLYEVQHLDLDDVVVFDESNIENLKLFIKDELMEININPNMDLLISDASEELEGANIMSETHNLWDSIEVEMNAEFDSVKISLGELKAIEQGLVVDLASLYKNNVTLKVEGKPIASGSLVIVNDRYGVKINQIIAGENSAQIPQDEENSQEGIENEQEFETEENSQEEFNESSEQETPQGEEGEEDFDYSDFELEDENI